MNKLVSIIVPTYNRCTQTIACIKSLVSISYDNYDIIVVDNGSVDDTVSSIKKQFPGIILIELSYNTGAVGARNEGMKHARGDYFCFVDCDNIVDKEFLGELVSLAETDEKIGFVGPKMYYLREPERIWCAGVKINLLTSRTTYIGLNEIEEGQYNIVRETDQIPNVWLVKRKVVNTIGIMDDVYVMSYGESDWPMRAWRAGYKSLICPSSIVFHDIDPPKNTKENIMLRGTPYRTYYFARNRAIFMKKFATKTNYIIFCLLFNNIFFLLYITTFIYYRKFDLVKSYIKGFIDGFSKACSSNRITTGT